MPQEKPILLNSSFHLLKTSLDLTNVTIFGNNQTIFVTSERSVFNYIKNSSLNNVNFNVTLIGADESYGLALHISDSELKFVQFHSRVQQSLQTAGLAKVLNDSLVENSQFVVVSLIQQANQSFRGVCVSIYNSQLVNNSIVSIFGQQKDYNIYALATYLEGTNVSGLAIYTAIDELPINSELLAHAASNSSFEQIVFSFESSISFSEFYFFNRCQNTKMTDVYYDVDVRFKLATPECTPIMFNVNHRKLTFINNAVKKDYFAVEGANLFLVVNVSVQAPFERRVGVMKQIFDKCLLDQISLFQKCESDNCRILKSNRNCSTCFITQNFECSCEAGFNQQNGCIECKPKFKNIGQQCYEIVDNKHGWCVLITGNLHCECDFPYMQPTCGTDGQLYAAINIGVIVCILISMFACFSKIKKDYTKTQNKVIQDITSMNPSTQAFE